MLAQEKTERILRLMMMMHGPRYYTIQELSSRLGMSARTIYRYMETFKDVGFTISRENGNIPRLLATNRRNLDLDDLLCISKEEAAILAHLIESLDQGNAMKAALKEKLLTICDQTPVGKIVSNRNNADAIDCLSDAIYNKKRVILHDYESGIALTISDRLVEPFSFSANYTEVNAFEPASGICKSFTVSCIGRVEVLDEPWENESLHKEKPTDIFRMCAEEYLEHVKIRLTLRAKNALIEDYPLSANYIREVEPPEGDSQELWLLETDICSVYGAGRFVLGLATDVEVVEGDMLKQYIAAVTENFLVPDYLTCH